MKGKWYVGEGVMSMESIEESSVPAEVKEEMGKKIEGHYATTGVHVLRYPLTHYDEVYEVIKVYRFDLEKP